MTTPRRPSRVQEDLPKYYDRRGVLQKIEERPVEFALDEELRRAILKRRDQDGRKDASV